MNPGQRLVDSLYVAWTIAMKDVLDALKNKNTLVTLVVMIGMVFFFYWASESRPFDRDRSVVVYDEGKSNLAFETAKLSDGSAYTFTRASSRQEVETKMAYRDLGLTVPALADQSPGSSAELVLTGYVFWSQRMQVPELEAKYTQGFTELLRRPVRIQISQDFVIPQPGIGGMETTKANHMLFFVFWTAVSLIPYLMLEEKQTKTLDALLVSPATPGQIVLGKALAGSFYIAVVGTLACALNWTYITDWVMAAVAFLSYALFSIGVALILGSFVKSPQQLGLWGIVLVIVVVLPPLFYMEPNLKPGLREILAWFPASALATLFRFSCSAGISSMQLGQNLAVAIMSIGVIFALVVWQVRRSDR